MYCHKCGNELNGDSNFCRYCGAATEQVNDTQEEQEFLDTTHRLLRWERTAWSIAGKVFLIIGIVFAGIFGLMALVSFDELQRSGSDGALFAVSGIIGFVYAIVLGGVYIATGIVGMVCCNKMSRYMDSIYTDFLPTRDRCTSVGMIVLGAMFNCIAMTFYIINFMRMKSCGNIINRILSRQARFLSSDNETR